MESGDRELYVRPFPGVAASRWQVSRGGAKEVVPAWSHDGTEIFYLDPSDAMMAARTTAERGLRVTGVPGAFALAALGGLPFAAVSLHRPRRLLAGCSIRVSARRELKR